MALPPWAVVTPTRLAHIERVVQTLEEWARTMQLSESETARWTRAGWLHDALRDAPEAELARWAPEVVGPVELLHGPASAAYAESEGESDREMLSAVRWHSVGCAEWSAIGRALYCADYLEPGRNFAQAERRRLAAMFPFDSAAVLATVVAQRIEYARIQGWQIPDATIAFARAVSP